MNRLDIQARLTREIVDGMRMQFSYFADYEEIIVYYDNGQYNLTSILVSVFTLLFPNVAFRRVLPIDYVLFQAADMICTLELTARKFDNGRASKSEIEFFGSAKAFRKNYLKWLKKKRLN